jgi:preprotein translocase SecE subunit
VARDRQRAKQRKQRRLPQQSKRDDAAGQGSRAGEDDSLVPEPRSLHRENVPGPVEHLGDVDEFEAALVSGADGVPEDDPDAADRAALGEDVEPSDAFGGDRDGGDIGIETAEDAEEPVPHGGAGAGAIGAGAVASRSADQPAHGRGGGRFINFLRASWAELQRVQWPDRRQVGQASGVVLGFVIVAGAFLGFADFVAKELVDLII